MQMSTQLSNEDSAGDSSEKNVDDVESQRTNDEPITFADLGIPTSDQIQDTVVGKRRPFSDVTWLERFYFVMMIASILAVTVFSIVRIINVSNTDPDFTFCIVLFLNSAFCCVFLIEGVLRERPSELFILSTATGIILAYLIANYAGGTHTTVKLARLITACVLCPVLTVWGMVIAWQYHVSKRLIFRTVGANEVLQTLYRRLLAFQDFLKFDLQLGGSLIILILASGIHVNTRDIVILAAGGSVTLLWFIFGFISMPRESTVGAVIFFLFSPVEVAYIGYKMYDVSKYIDEKGGLASATIVCGAVALFIRVSLVCGAVLVFRGFGQGLKDKLYPPKD